jgi:hypothetical protein
MIIAVCIAAAHDHRQFAAFVQPAPMQSGGSLGLGYAKPNHPREGRAAVEISVTAVVGEKI